MATHRGPRTEPWGRQGWAQEGQHKGGRKTQETGTQDACDAYSSKVWEVQGRQVWVPQMGPRMRAKPEQVQGPNKNATNINSPKPQKGFQQRNTHGTEGITSDPPSSRKIVSFTSS